jgi:putative transposase
VGHYGLGEAGIRVVQTPFQVPNANAYAERFVRSIKHECLNRVIPFGERHLRRTIAEFVEHYHRERNHQGLGNELIDGRRAVGSVGEIRGRQRQQYATDLRKFLVNGGLIVNLPWT